MRKKKAIINICFSLLLQLVTVVAGFIVPRLFIGAFGSEVNGLVNSITSFVGYITLLQAGVGSVVKASLYKPLAKKDHEQLCTIIKTASNFFIKIAMATILYLIVLSFIFPIFFARDFDRLFTISLVIIIGISVAAQYFFGITHQMLLEADQRSFVYSIIQILSIIVNTVLVVVFINLGFSVQIVKLASAAVFVARPLIVSIYSNHYYHINKSVAVDTSLIKQRWDGFIQAIALFIHQKTDIFVLTIFATFSDISVYSVYALVTNGLSSLIDAIDKAVRSAFGNIIACDEKSNLLKSFNAYNTLMHILSTICFSTASVVVFNFVSVYIKNISDAEYIQPVFGMLIIAAEFVYCLRMPYNSIVYAAGKFKETKIPAGVEAGINVILSCILVPFLGLTGVAIGTLIAMSYRTISFAIYLGKDILFLDNLSQLKRYLITFINYCLVIGLLSMIEVSTSSYIQWFIYALVIFIFSTIITIALNLLFDYHHTRNAFTLLLGSKNKVKD